ncbi:hypothetical protein ACFFGH_10690 [Lysobacter korlensis]|uniref:Uncharacterized protein n=1 Tax=Lysobacter korlensis TaxID=553636 RepID=A0ABV6RMU9_9GAMM
MHPTETINPDIPPLYDLLWTGGLIVIIVLVAAFLLLLYGVVKRAVRNGMREHREWLEWRQQDRADAPQ